MRLASLQVEQQLTRTLGAWAAGSLVVGGALCVSPRTRRFGRQTAAWGAVDGVIAWVGVRRRRRKGPADPDRLRTVLLANAGLDIGYLAIGARLRRTEGWRDDGLAVLVQGGFLLVLDTAAAARLR